VDLEFPTQLLRPLWAAKGGFQVRYARDIKLGDLKGSNLILSGVAEANPWVSLFEKKMNFQFAIDESTRNFRVSNRSPAPGESAAYFNSPGDPATRAYGLLALQPGLMAGDLVLIAEGWPGAQGAVAGGQEGPVKKGPRPNDRSYGVIRCPEMATLQARKLGSYPAKAGLTLSESAYIETGQDW